MRVLDRDLRTGPLDGAGLLPVLELPVPAPTVLLAFNVPEAAPDPFVDRVLRDAVVSWPARGAADTDELEPAPASPVRKGLLVLVPLTPWTLAATAWAAGVPPAATEDRVFFPPVLLMLLVVNPLFALRPAFPALLLGTSGCVRLATEALLFGSVFDAAGEWVG